MTAVRQVLVLSSGRSGSTLLDRLLGRHPDIASLGEVMQWPKNLVLDSLCTCGEPMSSCAFWQQVAGQLKQSINVDVNAGAYCLDMGLIGATRERDEAYYTHSRLFVNALAKAVLWAGQLLGWHWALPLIKRQAQHSLALYDAVRSVSGAAVVVDSSKQYLRGISIYRQSPSDTRLIVLVRDGRAVLHSRMQSGLSVPASVKRWRNYYRRMLPCLRASVPSDAVLYLHYEALASEPVKTLSDIFAFLGLPAVDALASPERDVHMAEGNAMRFKPLTNVSPDVRWKTALPGDARQYFEKTAGRLNRELGYGDD